VSEPLLRATLLDQVGFKPTGRCCDKPGCPGRLADHILDWEDALPAAELKATQQHASSAVSNQGWSFALLWCGLHCSA
jgi:hypothetical protein